MSLKIKNFEIYVTLVKTRTFLKKFIGFRTLWPDFWPFRFFSKMSKSLKNCLKGCAWIRQPQHNCAQLHSTQINLTPFFYICFWFYVYLSRAGLCILMLWLPYLSASVQNLKEKIRVPESRRFLIFRPLWKYLVH